MFWVEQLQRETHHLHIKVLSWAFRRQKACSSKGGIWEEKEMGRKGRGEGRKTQSSVREVLGEILVAVHQVCSFQWAVEFVLFSQKSRCGEKWGHRFSCHDSSLRTAFCIVSWWSPGQCLCWTWTCTSEVRTSLQTSTAFKEDHIFPLLDWRSKKTRKSTHRGEQRLLATSPNESLHTRVAS